VRIFLTGATGVVGRRFIPLAVAAGHTVTAVGRSLRRRDTLGRLGAAAVALDLSAPDLVRRAVTGHDIVVNLATHVPPSTVRMFLPGAWWENDRLRRRTSAILASAALATGVSRLIQESFAVYADHGDEWIDESDPPAPVRYNRSILDAERAAARFAAAGRIGIVLRFANFYGPDAFQTIDSFVVARRGWAPIPGPPDAFVSSVSHDDAATAVLAAIELPAGTYNVTDDEPLCRRDYAEALAEVLGLPNLRFPPGWTTKLAGSLGTLLTRSQRISNAKLRGASAWRPRYPSIREGWLAIVEPRDAKAGSRTDTEKKGGP
jgi:nucleoside-diphosphate-sugar epimerase